MADENLPITIHYNPSITARGRLGGAIVSEMVNGGLAIAKNLQISLNRAGEPVEALFQAGEAYYYGWDRPQSYEKAARCYQLAASRGHMDTACNFGCMLTLGLGVEKDSAKSLSWFEQAASQGHPVGWFNLSHHCASGIGTTHRKEEAHLLFDAGRRKNEPSETTGCGYFSPFNSERSQKFITYYEMLRPTIAELKLSIPRERNSALMIEDNLPILRKVRLARISDRPPTDYILILVGCDAGLTCGDLVALSAFDSYVHHVLEQGGQAPEGIRFYSRPPVGGFSIEASGVVGKVNDDQVELTSNVLDRGRTWTVISSLYERGLGIRQNSGEALKCAEFAKMVKRR